MSNVMSDNLMKTLGAIQAKDSVIQEASRKSIGVLENGQHYDRSTGEVIDTPAYEPLEAPEVNVKEKDSKVPEMDDSDAVDDYNQVRNTTYAVQEAALFMMTQVSKLAASTESPRVYSVFKELGELVRGCNKDLIENQKSITASRKDNVPKTPGEEETQIGYRENEDGSTEVVIKKKKSNSADLLRVIEEQRRKMEIDAAERAQRLKETAANKPLEEEIVESEGEPRPEPESGQSASDAIEGEVV